MTRRIEDLDKNFQAAAPRIADGLSWITARDPRVAVNGLPWFQENSGEFLRLPKRAKGVVRDVVWELSTMPSGGRVRFKTDSTTLRLRIQHSRPEIAMPHMCAVGVSGIDLYEGPPERMVYWGSNKNMVSQQPYVSTYFEKLPRELREFTLYLPTYNDLTLLEIGLDADATLAPPSPFRLPKPVVIYGTSITQGGCSSRGATGYVPLLGRMLEVDVINLGFSGNGKAEPELAELVAELDAACYVNDCLANLELDEAQQRYATFNQALRAKRPDIPLLLMTSILWAPHCFGGTHSCDARNELVLQNYADLRQRGDKGVHLLECREVIGIEADHPSVDGGHLTDLGFKRLADGVAPVLRKILKLG